MDRGKARPGRVGLGLRAQVDVKGMAEALEVAAQLVRLVSVAGTPRSCTVAVKASAPEWHEIELLLRVLDDAASMQLAKEALSTSWQAGEADGEAAWTFLGGNKRFAVPVVRWAYLKTVWSAP